MRVRVQFPGITKHDHAAQLVAASLIAALPAGIDPDLLQGEILLHVDTARLVDTLIRDALKTIDSEGFVEVDWAAEPSERDVEETPLAHEPAYPVEVRVPCDDSWQVAQTLRLLEGVLPAGLFVQRVAPAVDAVEVTIEVTPRWLVERAVADGLREIAPTLALRVGRVEARIAVEGVGEVSAEPEEPAVCAEGADVGHAVLAALDRSGRTEPVRPIGQPTTPPGMPHAPPTEAAMRAVAEMLEPNRGGYMRPVDGYWIHFAADSTGAIVATHPSTGKAARGMTERAAADALINKLVSNGGSDAPGGTT